MLKILDQNCHYYPPSLGVDGMELHCTARLLMIETSGSSSASTINIIQRWSLVASELANTQHSVIRLSFVGHELARLREARTVYLGRSDDALARMMDGPTGTDGTHGKERDEMKRSLNFSVFLISRLISTRSTRHFHLKLRRGRRMV